jgi:hypothetical protein
MEELGPFYIKIVEAQAEGDWEKGLRITLEGVAQNDGMSLWWYGYLHERGLWGKTVDPEIAFHFYEKSAEQNCQRGIAAAVPRVRHKNLQKINEHGALFIQGLIPVVIPPLDMLTEDPFVLYHARMSGPDGAPTTNSVACLKKSAYMGFAPAQYSYYLWNFLSQRDSTYLIKAASQRFAPAVESLCSMYLGQAEYVKAHYWFKMSAYDVCGAGAKLLFTKIDNCRASVMTLIAIRKYCCHGERALATPSAGTWCCDYKRKTKETQNQVGVPNFCDALTRITKVRALGFALSIFPKELVVMFAKALWATWRDDAWGTPVQQQQQSSPKRLKQ